MSTPTPTPTNEKETIMETEHTFDFDPRGDFTFHARCEWVNSPTDDAVPELTDVTVMFVDGEGEGVDMAVDAFPIYFYDVTTWADVLDMVRREALEWLDSYGDLYLSEQ